MAQLTLFALPRELERGEPVRCATCGRCDHLGGFGPPGLYVLRLPGGDEWNQDRAATWLCRRHAAKEWEEWMERQQHLRARLERLAMFRTCRDEGFTGSALWTEAERRLRA